MCLRKRIFCVWATLFLSFACFAQPATQNNFPKTLELDNRQWTLDNHQENEDVQLGEYVTNGENVNNWTELVTLQNFKFPVKADLTPSMFADVEMSELKKENYEIVFKNIESNNQQAIIEFRVTAPKDKQQDEIQRIIITPDHKLIVVHYVTKKADMGATARKTWIEELKNLDVSFMMSQPQSNKTEDNSNKENNPSSDEDNSED